MKFGVVVFPGSNCDHDAFYAIGNILRKPVEFIWHQSQDLANCDAIILPGGFSYGDYLRTGAIARFSPVMKSVEKFANSGGMVLGICNGFQTLCEAGLLPGAMMRNSGLRFICRHVYIRVELAQRRFFVPDVFGAQSLESVDRRDTILIAIGPGKLNDSEFHFALMGQSARALFFMVIVHHQRRMDYSRDPSEQRQQNAQEKAGDPAGH